MKARKKIILGIFVVWMMSSAFSYAQDYILFYGNGCPHCKNVEDFFDKNQITEKFDIIQKEVFYNKNNLKEMQWYMGKHDLTYEKIGVPFLIVNSWEVCEYINGDQNIIKHFQEKLDQAAIESCEDTTFTWTATSVEKNIKERLSFFGIMLPAAISDSINPCEFAVMLLLLGGILAKTKSRRKAILSGLLFSLAVFVSYFLMWLGLFSALASSANTFYLKLAVWILGILVGLANLKDVFRYGKWFVMEVPFSRRPRMADLIDRATSPIGAFFIGLLVSLFLLPCTSGPYFTILGYLASESDSLHLRGYIYLFIYNIFFILPMLAIALLVGFGYKSVEELAKIKHKNTKLIHLIVGLLMLGLWLYVLLTL